jgi:hypothetical protein
MEASTYTVRELLGELFPECDIDTGLKRIQTFVETLADRISALIERVLIPGCEMVERLERLPPVPGYEPILVGCGHYPPTARGLSHWIIRSGKDQANKARVQRTVVDAIRFLAKPGRQKRSISRRAGMLLEMCNTTSNLDDIFNGVDVHVFEFADALEGAVRGDLAACQCVAEVAAALAPRLSVRRGPKASAASIAHEFLLTLVANMAGQKGYTHDHVSEDYTDPLTRATRLAFGDPDFDPGPARRRQRKRARLKSN